MSKQEEIKEGMQDWIDKYGYSLNPADLIEWLATQGVVLEVNGDLPLNPYQHEKIPSLFVHCAACAVERYLDILGTKKYAIVEPLVVPPISGAIKE